VLAFSGSDIEGVDVRLEPASEIDTLSTQKEQTAEPSASPPALAGPLAVRQAQNDPRSAHRASSQSRCFRRS
jgi:hypothetical protein